MQETVIAVVALALVLIILGVVKARGQEGGIAVLAPAKATFRWEGAVCLLCTTIGVALSFLAFNAAFELSRRNVAGMIGVAVVTFVTNFGPKQGKATFNVYDYASFTKEGFLWTVALPTIATAMGAAGPMPKG